MPILRWQQTAGYGYVPNPAMPRTFMATAVDLGAFEGGCGGDGFPNSLCIHPGYKQEVGARLVRGAMAVAYNDSAAYSTGPIFVTARLGPSTVVVRFSATGAGGIEVRTPDGFELESDPGCWTAAAVQSVNSAAGEVILDASGALAAGRVRYLWSQNPCQHPHYAVGNCSVYAKAEGLPATPFVAAITPSL